MANTPWFLNPTLLPAAFGLIGVIVGGLITAGSAFLLERRREKREREREQRIHDTEVRTAARLVELDVRLAHACAEISVKSLKWSPLPLEPLTWHHWDKYRATLASELSTVEWGVVVTCVEMISQMNYRREQARRENKIEIDNQTLGSLEAYIVVFELAKPILLHISGQDEAVTALPPPYGSEPDTQSNTASSEDPSPAKHFTIL